MEFIEKIAPLLSDPVFQLLSFGFVCFILGWGMCLFCHAIGAIGECIMDFTWKLTHKKPTPDKESS